jgi:hypothetical protein
MYHETLHTTNTKVSLFDLVYNSASFQNYVESKFQIHNVT